MKKKILILVLTAILTLGLSAQAQTNNPPAISNGFFSSVQSYFASFNTNSTTFHKSNEIDLWAGMDYQSGLNIASHIGFDYNLWKSISIGSVTRNASVAGTIVGEQLEVGWNAILYDTKITGFVGGGYDFQQSHSYLALGARVKKALTDNTFAYVGLEGHFHDRKTTTPILSIGVGVTF